MKGTAMSPSKFDFRISVASMAVLFVATALITVGIKVAGSYGFIPFASYLSASGEPKFADYVFYILRALLILFVAVQPFSAHVEQRPVLFWVTWSVSLTGSAFPYLLLPVLGPDWLMLPQQTWNTLSAAGVSPAALLDFVVRRSLYVVSASHFWAAGMFWFLMDWDRKIKNVQNGSIHKPA